jgi:hypothetical protein
MNSDSNSALEIARNPRVSVKGIFADVARHSLPLLSLYVFHHSIANYALLTAFDLSLGLMLIVGTTRDRTDPTTVDPRSRWFVSRLAAILMLAIFLGTIAAIITIPIGMPAFIFGLFVGENLLTILSHQTFWIPVIVMSLLAALRAQVAFEATTAPVGRGEPTSTGPVIGNLEEDRRRSLAAQAAQVTLIAAFAALCYVLIPFGRWGLYALPILYAALLVFYDVRPDIGQRIFPELWQEK